MFEIGEKGQAIHDVWIEDGIAYSSNWKHGVYIIDVGNGVAGGSPSNPVVMSNYSYESEHIMQHFLLKVSLLVNFIQYLEMKFFHKV